MAVAIAVCSILVAACGNEQVNPSGPARTPTASVSAGPTASGSPTPAPSRDPGQVAVTRFFTLVTGAGFSYQASFSGDSRHTVNIVPIRNGLLQVSGKNVLVRAKFTINGRSGTVEHRLVGGRAWLKFGPLAWARWTNFQAADSMAAFAAVHAPPDVTYLGPTKVGGKAFYRVTLASAIVNPVMIPAGNLTEESVTDSKLELLIDASGRPVSGTTTITGRGRVSGQLQEIIIELKITFTKVGQKVTIAAP
jgi:hypothetical protein